MNDTWKNSRTRTRTHTHTQSCTCRLREASFHCVFCSSTQQTCSKGPELFIITKVSWGLGVTRETWWGDGWNMRRPLCTSRLTFKWCKQTPSITECTNLLRVQGARNFTSLGLLPYLIRQHPSSSSPIVSLSCSHSWRLALLKTEQAIVVASSASACWWTSAEASNSLTNPSPYPIRTVHLRLASLSTPNFGNSNLQPLLLYPQQFITP